MKKTVFFAAALLILAAGLAAEEAKYTNDSVARVSFMSGKTFIQRASDLGYEEAALNTPVAEGDRIGTAEGRAEIHFGRGNYIRLDENTKVDMMSLPKKGEELVRFRVWSGSTYLVVGSLRKEKSVELHTPDSSFYILEKGIYRVDVREGKDTDLFVFEGVAEAAGESGSLLVKASQRLAVSEGRFDGKPAAFMAVAEDAFDRFNQSRNAALAKSLPKRYLPEELADFETELDQYGQWVYLAPYGYVWVPGGVEADWRPYWNGRWVWLPLTGWTWVPYEPWGWATFHYGRWHWGVDFGWYWIPTSIWGPAWVSWWWDMDYLGWAPLSWWGYPVVVLDGVFYGNYYGPYYPVGSRALTVIRKDRLKDPHVSAAALRNDSLQGVNRISMTADRLNLRPVGTRISVQPLDQNRLLLKKDVSGMGLEQGPRAVRDKTGVGDAGAAKKPTLKPESGTGKPASSVGKPEGKSAGDSKPPAPRRIRKKETSAQPSGVGSASPALAERSGSVSPRAIRTYPSSPSITREKTGGGSRISGSPSRSGPSSSGRGSSVLSGKSGGASSPRLQPRSGSSSRSGGSSRPSSGSVRSSGGSRRGSGGVRKK